MTTKKNSGAAPGAFKLPATTDLAAVNAAEVEMIRLAAARKLSTREALDFTRMLDHRRRAIADRQLEEIMLGLEKPEEDGP